MTKHRSPSRQGRTILAAAALVAGGLFTGSTEAAPLTPVAVETVAGEAGTTAVHWRGRGHHWGHHHRHFGWGRPRHHGWHHHHHGWGHRHHGWGHRHRW